MENPAIPLFTLNLGGHSWPLRFEHRDFAQAECDLGEPILTRFQFLSGIPSYMTGILLFVGIRAAYNAEAKRIAASASHGRAVPRAVPKLLTLEDAQALITFENAAEVEQTIAAAVKAYFPTPKEDAPQEGDPLAQTSSGTGDGALESTTSDLPAESSGA